MYSSSKESGAIVGRIGAEEEVVVDVGDAAEGTGCEESLQCADADGNVMTLSAQLDPASGGLVWVVERSEEEVEKRVLSTNQMTSMLHDEHRNTVYQKAIEMNIAHFTDKAGRKPVVLDVGAGTGLLSMMAQRAGAEGVIGCEMFPAMAAVAEQVVADNAMDDAVQIVAAKSTDIDGFQVDMLVSELLDSALLGESCVFSHADAIGRLVVQETDASDDATTEMLPVSHRVIPHSATIYARLIESAEVESMVNVSDLRFLQQHDEEGGGVGTPFRDTAEAPHCCGGWPLLPAHWAMLKERSGGRELSAETALLRFDFTHGEASEETQSFQTDITVALPPPTASSQFPAATAGGGRVSGVLLYWRLDLLSPEVDPGREVHYCTRPPVSSAEPCHWQDHWVQCVFPLPKPIVGACNGDVVRVTASHNNLNIWLTAESVNGNSSSSSSSSSGADSASAATQREKKRNRGEPQTETRIQSSVTPIDPPRDQLGPTQCSCGWHLLLSTDRLLMVNDKHRQVWFNRQVLQALDKVVSSGGSSSGSRKVVLDVGDASVLALTAAHYLQQQQQQQQTAASRSGGSSAINDIKVVSKESKLLARLLFSQLGGANDLGACFDCWDGTDFSELCGYFDATDRGEEGEGEDDTNKMEEEGQRIEIVALISDLYQFQLSAKPTWQALSFHYQRTAVAQLLAPGAPIVPARARLMCAVFELTDLHVSHGTNGVISGFDHSHLDGRQQDWEQYWLPYKLADYRKKELCAPTQLQILDFSLEAGSLPAITHTLPVIGSGRLDCLAVWVDYGSSSSSSDYLTTYSDQSDFPAYYKANLRFFPQEQRRNVGSGQGLAVMVETAFQLGDSDFSVSFSLKG